MYKAVFIDMDGTLLSSDHSISHLNKNTIEELLSMGILVVPISARPLHGILPIIKDLLPDNMPVVSLNGSYIFHNNEIIFQETIPLTEVVAIHNDLQELDLSVMYYSQMEWFASANSRQIKKEQKITEVKIIIQPFEQTMMQWESKKAGPNKILIVGDKGLVVEIEKKLLDKHTGKLNIYKSQPQYLEVMNLNASKTKAIEYLLSQHGIDRSRIIAMGDNYNDKEMIQYAGTGVAMGNAPEEIKLVADYVTDTNNNDGVAKAINHFFKLKKDSTMQPDQDMLKT